MGECGATPPGKAIVTPPSPRWMPLGLPSRTHSVVVTATVRVSPGWRVACHWAGASARSRTSTQHGAVAVSVRVPGPPSV